MRILFILWTFSDIDRRPGGLELSTKNIIQRVKSAGHNVTVIATLQQKERHFENSEGIHIYRLPFSANFQFVNKKDFYLHRWSYLKELLRLPACVWRMWWIFRHRQPEIVNMHYFGPLALPFLITSLLFRCKFIFTLHGYSMQCLALEDILPVVRRMFKKILKRADSVTAPSCVLLEDAARWEPSIREKSCVIGNGIDLDEFTCTYKKTVEIKLPKSLEKSKRYIYADYKYCVHKDYALLLFAYRAILDSGYDGELVLSNVDRQQYKNDPLPYLLDIEQKVKIVENNVPIDKETLLRNADCYISLSRVKFCDLIALEALCLGKPVIADNRNDIQKLRCKSNGALLTINTEDESEITSTAKELLHRRKNITQETHPNFYQSFDEGFNISPYILTVANLYKYKGINTLLKAFKKIYQIYPDITLVIAGEGVQRRFLQRLSQRIGLVEKVIFLGAVTRKEVVQLFKGCEFFVLPSWVEPFGIVNLEAMAAGKAIVASCVDGIPEIVKDGINGILVGPKDSNALAKAIMRLLDNRELRERLGNNGRKMVEDPRFSWEKISDEYLEVYSQVIGKR